MPKVKCRNNGYERYEKNGSEYLLWQQSFGQDEEQSKQIFSQGILTMLYQIQDSITELKEQISKKGTETIQAIMQTSLNNAKKEESTDTIMMKMLLPELIKNPESFQNLMQMAEIVNKSKK